MALGTKQSGIYKIESKHKKERFYIGSASRIDTRWNLHLHDLRCNKHGNQKLQNHYNKYGESDLLFSILLICDKEDLIKIEQYFIDFYNPWFNICKIAGSSLGIKRSETTKEKVRQANLGKKQSRETVEKRLRSRGDVWNKGLTKEDPRVARSVRNFHGVRKELRKGK